MSSGLAKNPEINCEDKNYELFENAPSISNSTASSFFRVSVVMIASTASPLFLGDSDFASGGVCAAAGFAAGGIIAGIKEGNTTKRDLAMIFCAERCRTAALYTTNMYAYPINLPVRYHYLFYHRS